MRQYREIKEKHPGTILLFRVGDFYETFGEDAILASKILGIVLTKRANGKASHVELAGFPHHSLDVYLPKLVRNGYRVAVCDQLEDPKKAKTIVKRGVTDMITPGIALHDQVIESKKNNFLCAAFVLDNQVGISYIDFSTGEFQLTQGAIEPMVSLIHGLSPAEILVAKGQKTEIQQKLNSNYYLYELEDWFFEIDFAKDQIFNHYQVKNLKGLGIENHELAIISSGAILHYLKETKHNNLGHLNVLSRLDFENCLWLDQFTVRNLELVQSAQPDGKSLLDVLDLCTNPMGSRLLRKWLLRPLIDPEEISQRHDVVSLFYEESKFEKNIGNILQNIGDLERMSTKLTLGKIGPRELNQMAQSIHEVEKIKEELTDRKVFRTFPFEIKDILACAKQINSTISEAAPALTHKGDIFKPHINSELDEQRDIRKNGKQHLVNIQQKAINATGISSLKIGFNNVFGYFLEVTNAHKNKVPEHWIRKQTLTNAERYITEELKEYEQKILFAEDRIVALEKEMYDQFLQKLQPFVPFVQKVSLALAQIDCLRGFGKLAFEQQYCRPKFSEKKSMNFQKLRHPVIETQLPSNEPFIPNDLFLDNDQQQIIVLTGPNMSGKSAILRQTALAVIMAQMGGFIPADAAEIGIVDKIFTRVGASDNISKGESTFMVEMLETSSILNNLSANSLVLLDEIGRGTSTYDGISLAWSIAEFLNHCREKPKVLFATHYHELNQLEKNNNGIVNYHISSKQIDGQVVFLRKLTKGSSNSSFGIHVAAMAGMPKNVLQRAQEILLDLETERDKNPKRKAPPNKAPQTNQIELFENKNKIWKSLEEELSRVDTNTLTPIEALLKLNELKILIKK